MQTESLPAVTHTRKRRFSVADANAIADLVAEHHTEKAACALLGISYDSWAHWKARNQNAGYFDQVFERVRASKMNGWVRKIEAAGTSGPKPDWRALAWLSERMFRQELGDSKADLNVNVAVIAQPVLMDAAKLAGYGQPALVAHPSTKQLPAPQPVVECPAEPKPQESKPQ